MANPEKLSVYQEGNTARFSFDPRFFKLNTLKTIVAGELATELSTAITIITSEKIFLISADDLKKVGESPMGNCKIFVDQVASAMFGAEKVVMVRSSAEKKKASRLLDPRYDTVFKDFLAGNPRLRHLG